MGKLADLFVLNLLWIGTSIPVFTVGASSSALYYTVVKTVRNDTGKLAKEFFCSFRENFKQGTALWGILLLIFAVLAFDITVVYLLMQDGGAVKGLMIALIVLLAVAVIWGQYCISYLARFRDSVKTIMKNSIRIMLSNLGSTVLIAAIFAITVMLFMTPIWPLLCLFFPAAAVWAVSKILEPVYAQIVEAQERRLAENADNNTLDL